MGTRSYLFAASLILVGSLAFAQSHTVMTTDQNFNTTSGKPITGQWECSAGGSITNCVSGTNPTPAPTATPQTIPTQFPTPTPVISGSLVSGNALKGTGSPVLIADAGVPWGRIPLMGGSAGANPPNGAVSSIPLVGEGDPTTVPGSGTSFQLRFPDNRTISKFGCNLQSAPGSGKSFQMEVIKGSSASGITCTVSDLATSCSDNSNTAAYTAGTDSFNVRITPSGTPTSSTFRCWAFADPS